MIEESLNFSGKCSKDEFFYLIQQAAEKFGTEATLDDEEATVTFDSHLTLRYRSGRMIAVSYQNHGYKATLFLMYLAKKIKESGLSDGEMNEVLPTWGFLDKKLPHLSCFSVSQEEIDEVAEAVGLKPQKLKIEVVDQETQAWF